ncbi:hypothetical protein EL22_20745 [Halostagnicola sp. A56]|uniref:hypothetical protein n=1 Tax=Halostagnicola sp. A56 TaxID=1495067 RepID=UPI0004A04ACC|nr:hypothetical protein [Halostagnicola sp. A56]KDE56770.1 hypothetical protein EL22_20745 [Halostagnicola sp. A56]
MPCNKNDYDIDNEVFGVNKEVKLWISDGVIKDVRGLIEIGGAGAAVYGLLVEKGVISAGVLAGPVAAVVGAIIIAYMGWIGIENDGCGVVIEMNVNPIAPVTTTPIVSSQ